MTDNVLRFLNSDIQEFSSNNDDSESFNLLTEKPTTFTEDKNVTESHTNDDTTTTDLKKVLYPELEALSQELEYELVTEERLTIPKIVDTTGYLSEKVDKIFKECNVRAIPVEVAGIMKQVSELKEHTLIELDDIKYAVSKEPDGKVLENYIKSILKQLSSGIPFEDNLFQSFEYRDTEYKTLKLIPYEWNYICSVFRDYSPQIGLSKDGNFVLRIGYYG